MIKVLCDVCSTEQDIEHCVVASLEFCGQHHGEYHALINETVTRLNSELQHKTKQAVEMLIKQLHPADVIDIHS